MVNVLVAYASQADWSINERRLIEAVRKIAHDFGFTQGEISIAIVDDAQIHALNRQYLDHDWPTDAISFQFDAEAPVLNGEVIVSFEMAERISAEQRWNADDELLLYVIHGALHLVGMDDQNDESAAQMRSEERKYLMHFEVPFASEHQ